MPKITIHDVAKAAGVSIGTVYRAVNNSGRISETTRQRVLETVDTLGYKPNTVARGLALRTKFNFSVLLPGKPDFFWRDIKDGVAQAKRELAEYGVRVQTIIYPDDLKPNFAAQISPETTDALLLSIVSLPESQDILNLARKHNIPVGIINEDIQSRERLFFYGPDNFRAGRMAAELLDKFCPPEGNLCVIVSPGLYGESTMSLRHKGFLDYMAKQSTRQPEVIYASFDDALPVIRRLLAERPDITGIYFDQASVLIEAAGLLRQAESKPVVIGHELSGQLADLLKDGVVDALLVQDKFCQGYDPLQIMYRYLLLGEQPEQTYNSNIQIMIKANLDYLSKTCRTAGYIRPSVNRG